MATKRPLVLGDNGELEQLQAGDTLDSGTSVADFDGGDSTTVYSSGDIDLESGGV